MSRTKIILAESNELIGNVLKQRLEMEGYDVELGLNGLQAEELIESSLDAKLLVAEELLPYRNGFELITLANEKNIKTIIICDADLEEKIMEAFELGAIDFIDKPFSPNELAARVKNALRSATNISTFPFKLR